MEIKKDVKTSYLVIAGAILLIAAIAAAYAAAGWKVRPNANDVEVHVRKLGPQGP